MNVKRRIIYGLVVTLFLLLVANILFEVTSKEEKKIVPEVPKEQIEASLSNTLNNYGIKSEWIEKTFVKAELTDSLNYLFKVYLPTDVSIPTLIKDLSNSFTSDGITIKTVEKKNYSNTTVKIFSNNKLKLQANLIHSKKIKREFAEYSFLVKRSFNQEENKLFEKANIFIDYTTLLTPSKNALANKADKYAVLINDELSTTEYALEEDFSKQKLINRISSIIIDFGRDRQYLIDEASGIYNSKIFGLLRDEFSKRGIHFIPIQKYPLLKGNSKKEVISLFHFYTTSLKGKKGKTFVVSSEDFLTLQAAIVQQIKMGDKVVDVKF